MPPCRRHVCPTTCQPERCETATLTAERCRPASILAPTKGLVLTKVLSPVQVDGVSSQGPDKVDPGSPRVATTAQSPDTPLEVVTVHLTVPNTSFRRTPDAQDSVDPTHPVTNRVLKPVFSSESGSTTVIGLFFHW